jgi:hypothetical protein
MLENYYDVARADEFQQLFGHLHIGQNPTPLHNQYLYNLSDPVVQRYLLRHGLRDGAGTRLRRPDHDRTPRHAAIPAFGHPDRVKYVGLQELGLSGDELKRAGRHELQALPPVQQKLAASQRKLEGYRATLQGAYGDRLRLRTFSVAALGFERLVWNELSPDG